MVYPEAVRRLTPEEAEKLQGFPTGWTLPPNLNGGAPENHDSPRYAALGNAVSVPVASWLGRRIRIVESKRSSPRKGTRR